MRRLNPFLLLFWLYLFLHGSLIGAIASTPYSSVAAFNLDNASVPVCTKLLFRAAAINLLNWRLNECPTARGTTYFFAQSASDNGVAALDSLDGRDGIGFGLTTATCAQNGTTIHQTGAFSAYTWHPGDQIYFSGGSNTTVGLYYVTSKPDNDDITVLTSPCTTGAGSGMTSSNGPKKTIAAANTLMQALAAPPTSGNTAFLFKRGDLWIETSTYTLNLQSSPATGQAVAVITPIPPATPMVGDSMTLTGGTSDTLTVSSYSNSYSAQTMTITFASNITHASHTQATWVGPSTIDVDRSNCTVGAWGTIGGAKPIFSGFLSGKYASNTASVGNAATRSDTYFHTASFPETKNVAVVSESQSADPTNVLRHLGTVGQVDTIAGSWTQAQTTTSGTATLSTSSTTLSVNSIPVGVFPTSGTLYCTGQTVTYTGTTTSGGNITAFTGCTIASGSIAVASGANVNGGTLYIHNFQDAQLSVVVGGVNSGQNLYASYSNNATAIYIEDVDGTRIDGISVRGYGAKSNGFFGNQDPFGMRSYGIKGLINGTNAAVISGCDVYFADNHCIGVLGGIIAANAAY